MTLCTFLGDLISDWHNYADFACGCSNFSNQEDEESDEPAQLSEIKTLDEQMKGI